MLRYWMSQSKQQIERISIGEVKTAIKYGAKSTARPITRELKFSSHRLSLADHKTANAMNINAGKTAINATDSLNIIHD